MPVKEIVTKLTVDNADVKKKLSDAEKTVLKFSAVIAGISASMSAAAVYTAQWQDATVKASRAAGVSVETFSSLAVAAEKSNVSTEELSKSLGKLNNTTPELSKNLASVGISVRDTSGHLKTADTLLGEVSETMKKYKNPADQAAVATKVFGEEGGKLVNLLKDGKAGLAAARVEAEKYGLVVTESAAAAAEKFNDDLTETKNAIKGLTSSIGESIIAWTNQGGIMNVVRDAIAGVTQFWRGLSAETKNVIITTGAILTAMAALIAAFIALNAILPTLKAGLATAFGPIGLAVMALTAAIAGLLKFFSEYGESARKIFQPVVDAAKTAWESIKGLVDSIAKIFSPPDDAALQESLERTGKNMGETQKGASAFAKVMASLAATVSTVFQIVSSAIALIANGLDTASQQITNFKGLVSAAMQGNADAAQESWKKMTIAAYKGTQKTTAILDGLSDGLQKTWKAATNLPPPDLNFTKVNKSVAGAKQGIKELGEQTEFFKFQLSDVGDKGEKVFNRLEMKIADGAKRASNEITGYVNGIGSAMKSITNVITGASKYNTAVQLRDLEVLTIRSKKAYEEMRAAADAEETAKAAALEKSYDDQINALKDAEAEKTAAIEFESKQRLLLNDEEYQTKKAQAEAAHAAFMEAERVRFEEEKALMDERTVDKEQRRLNEGVMEANWQAYVKAQEALLQQQLNDLAKNSGDKKTKIDSESKAKLSAMTKQNAEDIKALEAAKAEALKKTEEEKNKRLAQIDADRTAQEKAEEKRRLQIQYDAEVQDFEQTKAVKITDVIISGITAAANAFAALAPIPFIGWGLGIAAAAAITGATAASVSQINSQRPVKPAALIAEDGGFAVGARHSMGGIPTEIEGGELITSRGRTKALFDALDAGAFGGGGDGPAVVFQNCTFSASNPEEMAEMINNAIGAEVRRLGIAGA